MLNVWIIILISQLWLIASMFSDSILAAVYAWVWIAVAVAAFWMMRGKP